jgi:hypothetical protein
MSDTPAGTGQTRSPKRGATPSPRYELAAATPHTPAVAAPPNFITVPKQINMWGNYDHGDCVTAEEAFSKACNKPGDIHLTTGSDQLGHTAWCPRRR